MFNKNSFYFVNHDDVNDDITAEINEWESTRELPLVTSEESDCGGGGGYLLQPVRRSVISHCYIRVFGLGKKVCLKLKPDAPFADIFTFLGIRFGRFMWVVPEADHALPLGISATPTSVGMPLSADDVVLLRWEVDVFEDEFRTRCVIEDAEADASATMRLALTLFLEEVQQYQEMNCLLSVMTTPPPPKVNNKNRNLRNLDVSPVVKKSVSLKKGCSYVHHQRNERRLAVLGRVLDTPADADPPPPPPPTPPPLLPSPSSLPSSWIPDNELTDIYSVFTEYYRACKSRGSMCGHGVILSAFLRRLGGTILDESVITAMDVSRIATETIMPMTDSEREISYSTFVDIFIQCAQLRYPQKHKYVQTHLFTSLVMKQLIEHSSRS
eukprot:PhM_4_TR6228/c0_g1_i2/m.74831